MRHRRAAMRRAQRRKRPIDYILPFLVLLSIGVIGVMAFQVWSSWNNEGDANVYFYVAQGRARVLPYGQSEWDNAFSGTKLLLGDGLKTLPGGRVVAEFFNDTRVRLDSDTAITLSDVSKSNDKEVIALNLDNGSVWINGEKSPGVREAHYEVRTDNLLVRATGTIFEVENNTTQVVRVFEGDIEVDVIVESGGQERVTETLAVGVGQEIVLDDATLRAFEGNQTPSVLMAVSDEFKDSAWYRWNVREDQSPTDFSISGSGSSMVDDETDTEMTDEETNGEENPDDENSEDTNGDEGEEDTANNAGGSSDQPVITSPTSKTTTEGSFVLAGTVKAGTAAVVVNSNLGDYELSQFKEGDTEWSYNVSDSFGNLKPGENTFKVYAVNEDGARSSAATITITYEKDKVEITDDLTKPVVETYNGSSSSTTDANTVTVIGSIKGAEKVVVNGYTLSQFTSGGTQWKYVASTALGNLKPGDNTFEVYGIDPDGNKSEVVSFTINYTGTDTTPEPEETAPEEDSTPVEEEPAPEETPAEDSGVEFGF
ncbi:FecR domain-containing protein [Candidatus Peregrinibacteria bacterium]|nr:FecR domain-containing protein [Candidatus Peregrinibacteria bacterium]